MSTEPDEEKRALLHFLAYQRASVLSITSGLAERGWHTSVVPSGWTPAGLVEHLGGASRAAGSQGSARRAGRGQCPGSRIHWIGFPGVDQFVTGW